jgi:60 kDa SS-A/Ro ribonucleoprotein
MKIAQHITKGAGNGRDAGQYLVDDWTRLDRFLILGSEGGTYYASERKLTLDNAQVVERCVAADGIRTVRRIVEISTEGRAPKNDPALFALAIAAKKGDDLTRKLAYAELPKVARIGTHLFHFAEAVKALGGWGRGTRKAFQNWYVNRKPESLALQLVKYQQRDGWSHRDILRKCHVRPANETLNGLLHWAVKGWPGIGVEPHPDVAMHTI